MLFGASAQPGFASPGPMLVPWWPQPDSWFRLGSAPGSSAAEGSGSISSAHKKIEEENLGGGVRPIFGAMGSLSPNNTTWHRLEA